MADTLTIGGVARQTGLPVETIRFYESAGVIPAPARTPAGYRLYTTTDLRRLRLIRQARLLGLALPEVKALVERAFASECTEFADQLLLHIARQRADIERRIAELAELREALTMLESHVRHAQAAAPPGLRHDGSRLGEGRLPSPMGATARRGRARASSPGGGRRGRGSGSDRAGRCHPPSRSALPPAGKAAGRRAVAARHRRRAGRCR